MDQSSGDYGPQSTLINGFYRIRNFNPKLCLTLGKIGKDEELTGSSVYVDEQQDADIQKVCE
jgi:hypothetical protein